MRRPPHQRISERDAGYTLMELLIVLAILGLLTAIATPFVLRYFDHAKISTAKTEVANLSTGLDLFKLDVGRYPTSQEGLKALLTAPVAVENWNGPYIKKANALNDPWGRQYKYLSPGHHGDYDLYSTGPKGDESDGPSKPEAASW